MAVEQMPECSVRGCSKRACIIWPLLVPEVGLCDEHYKKPTPEYQTLVSAANSPPDDFEIPV